MSAVAPWAGADLDPERVVAELRRRYPGACALWGEFTGMWWALARDRSGRYRLVEAATPAELGRHLEAILPRFGRAALMTGAAVRSTPPPPRTSRSAASSTPPRRRREARRRAVGRRLLALLC
ncbi:hypothetical protein [Actinomadura sp. 9N407]|uniref:hypothetical protein n=1 Tax=Actinomadura sp. 9N407 TaxID=3375154 RepID=UPI00379CB14F